MDSPKVVTSLMVFTKRISIFITIGMIRETIVKSIGCCPATLASLPNMRMFHDRVREVRDVQSILASLCPLKIQSPWSQTILSGYELAPTMA